MYFYFGIYAILNHIKPSNVFENIQKATEKFKRDIEPKITHILSQIQTNEDQIENARAEIEEYLHESVKKTFNKIMQK